ncbi:MAG: transposase [Thaumarchaeota archaeon]|nr:transposase [Nitrososphaerota archaeon]
MSAIDCANMMLSKKTDRSIKTLWAAVGEKAKRETGFNSQVVCDIARSVSKLDSKHVRGITVKFNVPRNCKTFRTKEFFFVELGLYPRDRVAVPIRKNREWDRFAGLLGGGWSCTTFGLTPKLEIAAYLSKEEVSFVPQRNIIGVDINVKNFAYTVLAPSGDVLRQGYLGQQIWVKKRQFEERRALLQRLNTRKKLKGLRHGNRNYVKTNIGQLVAEIIKSAKKYDADTITIERLRRFKARGRRFNRRVMGIPFYLFRQILEGRCFDSGIKLSRVDPYHTSKWCTRCGAVGAGHSGGNYALYRCEECGQVVNSDRKASLAVAVKSLLERNGCSTIEAFQISGRRVPVSGLLRMSPMTRVQVAVPKLDPGEGKVVGFNRR